MNNHLRYLCYTLICIISSLSYGWNYAGHELISEIAYQDLDQDQQKKLNKILDALIVSLPIEDKKIYKQQPYGLSKLAKLSIMPDFWKNQGFCSITRLVNITDDQLCANLPTSKTYDWHYDNKLIRPEQANKVHKQDKPFKSGKLKSVIKQLIINTRYAKTHKEKALGIIYITHLLGDAHQPLHVISMQKDNSHDKGGNGFCLMPTRKSSFNNHCNYNLHSYWDSAGKTLNHKRQSKFSSANLIADYQKKKSLNTEKILDPQVWLDESFSYWPVVYSIPVNKYPSGEYQAKTKEICDERIALAGFRLSNLLKELL